MLSKMEEDEFKDLLINKSDEITTMDDMENFENNELLLEEIELDDYDIFQYLTEDSSDDGEKLRDYKMPCSSIEMDDSIFTFVQHKAAVFACAILPRYRLCATGGEDDIVYVWNYGNGKVLHKIDWHTDSVTELHFNHNGKYLASGDMAGGIILHRIRVVDGDLKLTQEWTTQSGDMSWLRLHPYANILICGCDSGEIYVWRFPKGAMKIFSSNGTRCECGEVTNDGKKLLTTYNNGSIKLWDFKSSSVLMEITEENSSIHHTGAAIAMATNCNSLLFATGGIDGKIIFCTMSSAVGFVLANGSIECLAFSPSKQLNLIASGTLNGEIVIWDYSKLAQRCICTNESAEGIIKIQWISDVIFLATTIKGNIFAFDGRSGRQIYALYGNNDVIYDLRYVPDESILLSVSENGKAKIFSVPTSTATE